MGGCPRIRAAHTTPESSPVRQAGVAPAPPRRARGSGLLGSARSLHAAPPWWAVARPRATRPPTPVSCEFRRAKPHRPSPRCRSGYLRAPAEIPETPFFSCFTYACPEPVLANMIVFHEKNGATKRVSRTVAGRNIPTLSTHSAGPSCAEILACSTSKVCCVELFNSKLQQVRSDYCELHNNCPKFPLFPIIFRGISANCPCSG